MTKMIAEIGLNHLGSEDRALKMLNEVLQTDIDAVTFQIREPKFYDADELSHRPLSLDFYSAASKIAIENGKEFGLALCDVNLIDQLLSKVQVNFWKTLSWDFTNKSLKMRLIETGLPVYLSTGLSSMDEVIRESSLTPNAILIHTQLSQAIGDVNLKAIPNMAALTNMRVAFGMHCEEMDILKLALAYEPLAIFFYVKEGGLGGLFDDLHAIDTKSLASIMVGMNVLKGAIGDGNKHEMKKPAWVVSNE